MQKVKIFLYMIDFSKECDILNKSLCNNFIFLLYFLQHCHSRGTQKNPKKYEFPYFKSFKTILGLQFLIILLELLAKRIHN